MAICWINKNVTSARKFMTAIVAIVTHRNAFLANKAFIWTIIRNVCLAQLTVRVVQVATHHDASNANKAMFWSKVDVIDS